MKKEEIKEICDAVGPLFAAALGPRERVNLKLVLESDE